MQYITDRFISELEIVSESVDPKRGWWKIISVLEHMLCMLQSRGEFGVFN